MVKFENRQIDAKMSISEQGKEDIYCWLEHIDHGNRRIWETSPEQILATDASNKGWGAVVEDRITNGLWSHKIRKHFYTLMLRRL